jgi:membrane-bound lytic murein transglycosylase B
MSSIPNQYYTAPMIRTFCLLALFFFSIPHVQALDFSSCLGRLAEKAVADEVSADLVREVVPTLVEQARVLELDRSQPEFTRSFADYFGKRVTLQRNQRGRELRLQYRDKLADLTRVYGVPGQYLLAFWGLETNFGSYLGNTPTLDSLATLACDERRSSFFTTEFVHALHLLEEQQLTPADMRGSWAGAVGHTQFMPSAYRRFAIDGDGDGSVNLWKSTQDALSSGANFLRHLGWRPGERWGREVVLPAEFDYTLAGLDKKRLLSEWRQLGIRQVDGRKVPSLDMKAALLVPSGHEGPAFLVYHNFSVIMGWNRSESYALTVGVLADRIAGAGRLAHPPVAHDPLALADVQRMQEQLLAQGFSVGKVDGIFGPASRAALARFQDSRGLVADGFPDSDARAVLTASMNSMLVREINGR